MAAALPLFGLDVPSGFQYRDEFVTVDEEAALIDAIAGVEFGNFEMHGVVARRRVAFFGASYDRADRRSPPIPEFLLGVRSRAAEWVGVTGNELAMALINEYRPGAPIGWHRDAPQYELIVGISLLSACRMKLRPYVAPRVIRAGEGPPRRETTHEITLERRSGYVIAGPARRDYEHSIPPAAELRYSITFRTLRRSNAGSSG